MPFPFMLHLWLPGNYLKFYHAIRTAYPDIQIISNCDGSSRALDHPADMYDYHVMSSNISFITNPFTQSLLYFPFFLNNNVKNAAYVVMLI